MNPIISVENLSKQYRIGTKLPYKTFRETIMNLVTSPAKLFRYPMPSAHRSMQPSKDGYIWALKDVSFEVK
ncbi:MAG: ABC transporter ATP-binding protein, partial [Nitrospirota bacterium]|nr:ABC transporter ATP-binding protein [Nitrospirota bacterium]